MKILVCLLVFTASFHGTTDLPTCIPPDRAESILGGPAVLVGSEIRSKPGLTRYACTYRDQGNDIGARDTCNFYYVLEVFHEEATAKKIFSDIVASNQWMPGFKTIHHSGNEIMTHTDNIHFQLVIIRRANKILRLKINKITTRSSMVALKNFAEEAVREL